ncbi:unnamed protein product [Cercospora beticola]|nr:unnamed protein product [Cercospora beticola]
MSYQTASSDYPVTKATLLNPECTRPQQQSIDSTQQPRNSCSSLSAINFDLAQQLEKAEQGLERRHASMAEMKEDLVRLWKGSKEQEAKREEAEAESKRLRTLVDRLSNTSARRGRHRSRLARPPRTNDGGPFPHSVRGIRPITTMVVTAIFFADNADGQHDSAATPRSSGKSIPGHEGQRGFVHIS